MSDQSLEASLIGSIQTDAVTEFCQGVLSRNREQWPITEENLAEEFLAIASVRFLPGFEEVSQICRERFGISVAVETLPDGMRGYNGSYGVCREILISTNQDFSGANLHTLLHELREILEHEFVKLGHPTTSLEYDLEERAESFAVAVQVVAAQTALPSFLESAYSIERRWVRIGAYILIFFGTIAYIVNCSSLARIEESLASQRRG